MHIYRFHTFFIFIDYLRYIWIQSLYSMTFEQDLTFMYYEYVIFYLSDVNNLIENKSC